MEDTVGSTIRYHIRKAAEETKEVSRRPSTRHNEAVWVAAGRTWNNITGIHGVLILDEAETVHQLHLENLSSAMAGEVALDVGLGSCWSSSVSGGWFPSEASKGGNERW
jgi:hypothetical protein